MSRPRVKVTTDKKHCAFPSPPNRSLDWVLSHWVHFTVLRFSFVYVCKCMYFLYDCILLECVVIVTW